MVFDILYDSMISKMSLEEWVKKICFNNKILELKIYNLSEKAQKMVFFRHQ